MTLTIPDAAMPVVEILRRDVKKPSTEGMFAYASDGTSPRFCNGCCPMGLHPDATSRLPVVPHEFCIANEDGYDAALGRAVSAFYCWWDGLTLEQAIFAVNELIWKTKEGESK